MDKERTKSISSKIVELQDEKGCWNVLEKSDKYYPEYNYYTPIYNSTLWTLILLADIKCNPKNKKMIKPLKILSNHLYNKQFNIYSLGKSHFPIPCLNGNMLYLHSYFHIGGDDSVIEGIIDFFSEYQRFDDGGFKTPSSSPYFSNHSCYGKHTCYWGIVKLLKGLSFLQESKRSAKTIKLIGNCIDFILRHQVCFSSHDNSKYLHTNIKKLTFPNMYQSDFLEILWILKREKVKSVHLSKAMNLLKSKMKPDSTWKIERQIKNMVIPMGSKNFGNEFITERAGEVLQYYEMGESL